MEVGSGQGGLSASRHLWRHAVMPACLAMLAGGFMPATVRAQDGTPEGRPWLIAVAHYGKWPALAGSAFMLARAALDRRAAEDLRDELALYCEAQPAGCAVPVQGSYADAQADALARAAEARDDRARNFMLGGEFTLIAAGAFFVLDLVHGSDGPSNIPFTPFRLFATRGRIGARAAF